MTSRAARQPGGDGGSALLEVLVASGLVVLVLALASTALATGQRTAKESVGRVQAHDSTRVALAELSRTLRTAVRSGTQSAVTVAEPGRVVLHANDRPVPPSPPGTGPTRTTYRIDALARTLVEERVPAGAWDPATQTFAYPAVPLRRVLARSVTVPQPRPVFRYHETVDPACLRAASCAALPLSGAGLSTADLARVRAVSVALSLDTPEVRGGSRSSLRTFVVLPNREEAVTG